MRGSAPARSSRWRSRRGMRRLHDLPLDVARRCGPPRPRRALRRRHRPVRAGRARRRRWAWRRDRVRADRQPHAVSASLARARACSIRRARACTAGRDSGLRAPAAVSRADAAHLCRLVLMQALPAARRTATSRASARRSRRCSASSAIISRRCRADSRFTSPDVARRARIISTRDGAHGIGQSSWGPTGFAFAASQEEAERLAARRARSIRRPGSGHPRLRGAQSRRRHHARTTAMRADVRRETAWPTSTSCTW